MFPGIMRFTTLITLGGIRICSAEERKNDEQRIVIIGAGSAGIGVAAMLRNDGLNVTIIDPSEHHSYQPMWTLVGCGMKKAEQSIKRTQDILPKSAKWIKASCEKCDPNNNTLTLSDNSTITYDYLIVTPGMQIDWMKIPGLKESLEKEGSGVGSIYNAKYAEKMQREIASFDGGRAIFSVPNTPIKCAGAPLKIMFLFEEIIANMGMFGIRDKTSVELWTPAASIFGVKKYADMLEEVRHSRGVKTFFKTELIKIDPEKKIATFKCPEVQVAVQVPQQGGSSAAAVGTTVVDVNYSLLHVVPPMRAPDFLKNSSLVDKDGWVDVDKHTLQSTKYPNVFALGDCTNTPNSKTLAAITSQAPVVVHNLKRAMKNEKLDGKYNGYSSCPLMVSKKRTILAEFGYDGVLMESFDTENGIFPLKYIGQNGVMQGKLFTFFKTAIFPIVYWKLWLEGRWFGPHTIFKPDVTEKKNK